MPGKAINSNTRHLIFRLHINFGHDSNTIYEILVGDGRASIYPSFKLSRNYLHNLCLKLNDPDFAEFYLLGPYPSGNGRPNCLDEDEKAFILQIIKFHKTFHLKQLKEIFKLSYRGDDNQANLPSLSTIFRMLKDAKISLKKVTRRHVRFDESEALAFFNRISHIPVPNLVFIDEASSSPETFLQNYGRAPHGEECLIDQIVIGNRSFSWIIAVSVTGIVAWHLVEGTISEVEFQNFLTTLRTRLFPENHIVLDNASIHRTENTQVLLEDISNGQFHYTSRYSPHLMPHEEVISLIKREIRERETRAIRFPVETITEVIELFQIGGSRSFSLFHLWNKFFTNHSHFLLI